MKKELVMFPVRSTEKMIEEFNIRAHLYDRLKFVVKDLHSIKKGYSPFGSAAKQRLNKELIDLILVFGGMDALEEIIRDNVEGFKDY